MLKTLYLDFLKYYKLDGYIKHASKSGLDANGYMYEEIILCG